MKKTSHRAIDTYKAIPELMRLARGSYKRAIDAQLSARGIEDLPRKGGYVLAYLVNGKEPERMIQELGFSKQAFSQLVDTLVLRSYVERTINAEDRRRMSLALTDRGRAAADAGFTAVRKVEEGLKSRLSAAELAGLRRGLAVLGEIKESAKRKQLITNGKRSNRRELFKKRSPRKKIERKARNKTT